MKIRTNYVSNRSSSSFVLNDCKDIEKARKIALKSFKDILSDEYWSDYQITSEGLKNAFNKACKKIHNKKLLRLYLFNKFYYVIMYYEWYFNKYLFLKNNCACLSCHYHHKNQCFHRGKGKSKCFWKPSFIDCDNERNSFLTLLKDFPFKYPENILKEVHNQMLKNIKITKKEGNFKYVHSFIDNDIVKSLINIEVNKWIKENKEAGIIVFSSDDGSDDETVIRYNLYDYIKECNKKGIKGFFSDNS